MFVHKPHHSLTRRGSKLLVEVVIGVIGIFGIMLAQLGEQSIGKGVVIKDQVQAVSVSQMSVSQESANKITPKIDWLELLY